MDRLGGKGAYASLTIDGTVNSVDSVSYPGTSLRILQELVTGTVSGDYDDPINAMVTCVRIIDPASPYYGSGFLYVSFTSMQGQGQSWAAIRGVPATNVQLSALFTEPFAGFAFGTLDESISPPELSFAIYRQDSSLHPNQI
jgi:hypothetical protein